MMMDVTPRKIKTVGLKNICTNKRNGACGMCKLTLSGMYLYFIYCLSVTLNESILIS